MVKSMETDEDQNGGILTQGSSCSSRIKVLKVPHQLEKYIVIYMFLLMKTKS
jgi:hypothetical protein